VVIFSSSIDPARDHPVVAIPNLLVARLPHAGGRFSINLLTLLAIVLSVGLSSTTRS